MSVEKLAGLFNGEPHVDFIDVADPSEIVAATAGAVPRAVKCLELAHMQVAIAIENRDRTQENAYRMSTLALQGIIGKIHLPLQPLRDTRHN